MPDLNSLRQQQKRYWRTTVWLTLCLLVLWFLVTYVTTYLSDRLDQLQFLGFPLGYFMTAQGALLVYLLIIGVYAYVMNRLDRRFGVDEQ